METMRNSAAAPCALDRTAETVADSSKIRRVLGWQPRHEDLDAIVRDALHWERIWLQRHQGGNAAR